ncbi:Gfo/Idh/MocA family oxidoreductase [Candidatus Amoebophilus asiaticus]|nr:Gfo/Idh/MocA family oxidoreductase [Candidatus Amoebophilus asiaticus]
MRKLNFVIVGCGRIAQRHADHIDQLANLLAVCDVKQEIADNLANKFSCHSYQDIESVLLKEEQIDVVSICTPNGLHAEHTIKALKAGFHVLCEKPMATNASDCESMIEEAEKARKKLFIVKQNRFNPPISALKQVIDEDRLGKIFNVQLNCFWNRNQEYYLSSDWKGKLALDGGTLFTQFSHFIDLLFWLTGDIISVKAFAKNFMHDNVIEFEDTGVVILEFENGALGTINYTVNSHNKNMEGSITVFGEKGTVKIGGQYLNVLEYQSIQDYKIQDLEESRPANEYGFYQGSMSNHDKVYENVIDVLRHEGKIATKAHEGMKVVKIIEDIYSEAKSLSAVF